MVLEYLFLSNMIDNHHHYSYEFSKQTHLLHTQDGEWQVAFWSYDTAQEPTPHSQTQTTTEALLATAASFTVHIISI